MKSLKIEICSKKEIKRQPFEIFSKMNRGKQWHQEKFFTKEIALEIKEQYLDFYHNVAKQLDIENTERNSSHFDQTGNWW